MAIFKSKKTYIKRYASGSADKKVTFAPSVKATFNSSAIKEGTEKPKPTISSRPVQPGTMPGGGNTTGTIRYGEPDEKYIKLFTDKKPEVIRNKVVSGPGVLRPEPAPKPDLTNVKADEHVRPVVEGRVLTYTPPVSEKKEEAPVVQTTVEKVSEPVASAKQEPLAKPETVVKPIVATAKKPEAEKIIKEKPIKQPKPPCPKADRSKIFSVAAKVAVLVVLVCGIGAVGYKFAGEYSQKLAALNEALNTHYLPEDYIYPETPDDVKAVNDAAREAAYNEAMANAYVPSRSEVPGLFKYDYVKTCYLTFDDGPSGPVTESILNTLKEYNVPATFFVVGKNAEAHPDLLRRIEAEGHSIGNHSYSHDYEYMYSGDPEFDDELYSCRNAINRILGKPYNNMLYRFPGGSFEVYKKFYIYNIESLGYQHVDWNALTGDSETENPDREYIMNALKESTNNGTKEDIVVLLHDAGAKQITADTLPEVIEYLKSKNYVFKAVKNSNFVE